MSEKPTYQELEIVVANLEHKISDQQNDIRLLSDDHTRLQAILETAIHAIIVVNDQARIIEWNSQAELICVLPGIALRYQCPENSPRDDAPGRVHLSLLVGCR